MIALVHPHGERLRVGLRIVDRDVDLQRAEVQPPEPLGDFAASVSGLPPDVEPAVVAEAGRLDDERVAFPLPDRVAVPPGCGSLSAAAGRR